MKCFGWKVFAPFLLLVVSSCAKKAPSAGSLEELFGSVLINVKGQKVEVSSLSKAEIIGIYFSAHWCPPCRAFTPKLVKAYNELKKKGESFEIVFVSADRSEAEMERYMKEESMPWLAVPYSSPKRHELVGRYAVLGIPTLIILDKNLKVVERDARSAFELQGAAAYKNWK